MDFDLLSIDCDIQNPAMIYVYKGDIFAFDSSNYRLGQQKASKHLKDGRDITQITYLYRKLLVFNYC